MTAKVCSSSSLSDSSLKKEAGVTWLELLVVVAIVAILLGAIVLWYQSCSKQNFSSSTTVAKQIQPLINQLLTSDDVSPTDFGKATDQIARTVIQDALDKGVDKDTLKKWFDEIIKQLNERKDRASNGKEKAKLEKAIDAVTKAYNDLVK